MNFDSITHTYTNDNGIKYISVTTLLQKYGIAEDYSEVPTEMIRQAADRGTEIHRQIQDFYEHDAAPEWMEAVKGVDLLQKRFDGNPEMERMVWDDGYKVAGRFDMLVGNALVDIKTSAELHTQSYAWQLSIYAYLIRKMTGKEIESLWILHLPKEQYGEPRLVDFTAKRIPDSEIERLFDANLKNEKYVAPIAKIAVEAQDLALIRDYAMWEARIKNMKKQSDAIKDGIYKYMLENDIEKAVSEDGSVTITLKKPYNQVRVDSTKLKKEFPDVYMEVAKSVECKGNVTISVSGKEE